MAYLASFPNIINMARIYKQARSPYFFADYTAPDGARRRVSTKKTEKAAAMQFLTSLMCEVSSEQVRGDR